MERRIFLLALAACVVPLPRVAPAWGVTAQFPRDCAAFSAAVTDAEMKLRQFTEGCKHLERQLLAVGEAFVRSRR